ncbi:uncharacterized protein yc1106_09940 [Curvularia clavata]|uniref:Uncharacterized protein n=1 Tax=Curvularia clavata TaxID=95742 RepID=A0A9Q8ZIJ4_CURCL|nr:uncharacterized protein yc1106_09940 [Curvularia clavata]
MSTTTSSRWNPFRRHVLGSIAEETPEAQPTPVAPRPKTTEATVTSIPSWPEEAQTLKQHDWISWLYLVADIILVLLPIYFILLGVAVITLNGKAVADNDFASKVTQAIQLGPTLFPIMFAAISGRSMKMVARYLAEKGAKLSTLELLMASQSVWGTVESQMLMRRVTLVGVNLLFLWAMSPLGGQASLRLMSTSTRTLDTYSPLRYLSTGPGSAAWAMSSGTYIETDGSLSQVEALYAAALMGSDKVKKGPEDTWGNVKIPYMEYREGNENKTSEWITVSPNSTKPEDYVSLVGIPVMGRPKDRDGKFSLETSQLTLQCEPWETRILQSMTDFYNLGKLVPGQIWKNMSVTNNPWGSDNVAGGKRSTFFLQTDLPITQGGDDGDGRFSSFSGYINASMIGREFQKRKLTYASSFGFGPLDNTTLSITNCSLGQSHTETIVECTEDNCAAVKVRRSLSDFRDTRVTPFDHALIASLALAAFPKAFGWSRGSNPTEQFIYNTTSFQLASPTTMLGDNPGWVNLSELTPEDFSRRFALVLNTYYQLTLAPNAYLGNLPQSNFSAFGPDTMPVKDVDVYLPSNVTTANTTFENWWRLFDLKTHDSSLYFIGATTNATISKTHAIYVCNFAWLGLLFIAAVSIFLVGAASLVLKRKTLGPEMFGFVTSMTYENPYLNVPRGGTTLDAMERARLLKDLEVYIGDVCGDKDVGHIALAAGTPMRKLNRGRLYL